MSTNKIVNIAAQALNPSRFSVMVKKVMKRLFDPRGGHNQEENLAWLRANCTRFSELAISLDEPLWREAEEVSARLEARAKEILAGIEHDLGGGGAYPYLYFITRLTQPRVIVETGVAAGFSSNAFLAAIRKNGHGVLFSSDFPYFRIPDPEKYIGVVVEEELKKDWHLYVEGDEANLPRIIAEAGEVDLVHYDSDKSYSGREFGMGTLLPVLAEGAVVLMDDIQDNSWFYDYVETRNPKSWRVFEFVDGQYVGMIGSLQRRN